MPFNPCGFGVDFLQRAATDYIRPFFNSPIVVKRRWFKCAPGAPILPFPTAFLSQLSEAFPWRSRVVGQVFPWTGRAVKTRVLWGFDYEHICGTATDFQRGAAFNPDLVVPIGPDWIPLCCHRQADATEGGIEIGGEAGDVFTTTDATEGGIEIGGEAGDVFRPPDATEGGIEIGGEAGDVFTPPVETCPLLSTTCAGAGAGQLNAECEYLPVSIPGFWRKWAPGSGIAVNLVMTIISVVPLVWRVYEGADCGDKTLVANGSSPVIGTEVPFTTTAAHVWLEVDFSPSQASPTVTVELQT